MLLLDAKPGLLESVRDQRSGTRRKLSLEASGFTGGDSSTQVLIHDLSQTGILIQTEAQLSAGEAIQVALPYGGAWDARVVWASDALFGCEFEQPLPKAAISAALLKAPAVGPGPEVQADETASWSGDASRMADESDTDKLSPRTRAMAIVGLSMLAWSPIAAAVALITA
jgi:hypothetical protein